VKKLVSLLVCALVVGAPVAALAQFTGDSELSKHWNLRVGFFVPEKKVSRDLGGDVWLALGAERAFYEVDRWKTTVSIDYYGAEDIYSVPMCLNLRGNSQGLRYGAGVGLSLGHDVEKGISALAYNLMVGYEVTTGANPITVDLRYLGTNASRQELNGWSLVVGYSF
jgi:hypothetical protein